ncbi:unnamed protein product [Dovyalis caffra]|uniref:Phorbol-ester/DAG-type domain-containing protein n=1 Tax=Dovyalis caffra TaxID=77055 RepID=A0AAV1QPW2_9ROSI|nr:unnamed protein product [Dovyalis caffra]
MPFSFNYEYECCACHEMGKFVDYKCFQCNYNLHTKCAILRHRNPLEDLNHRRSRLLESLFDRHTDFALMTTEDVILHIDKVLDACQKILEELDRISKDLGASSIDETLPLQHGNYLKRMKRLNEILEELYTIEI